jgi:hypothetical protein
MSIQKIRAAVIGPSDGGKTQLVIAFSLWLWKKHRLRTLAFDPWLREDPKRWGPHAWATNEWAKFTHVVTNTKGCCVVWDEATTNGGRDRDNIKLFTEIRHNHPVLFALGHCYSAFLPVMRVNLTDLFLALDDADDAAEWAKIMKDPRIMEATKLDQYEFLHKRAFREIAIRKHTFAELKAGVSP